MATIPTESIKSLINQELSKMLSKFKSQQIIDRKLLKHKLILSSLIHDLDKLSPKACCSWKQTQITMIKVKKELKNVKKSVESFEQPWVEVFE